MTSVESFFTSAPITPREVKRRYSNGRDFEVVLRNGYRNNGIWAINTISNRCINSGNNTHHLGREHGFHCAKQRIAAEREHYRLDLMLQR